ncbi:MAG TPA: hypothetical protein ENJ87_12190 [Gammaproteobacteria bacterium]|nr:hypothetical protein [Gammaproteobacteria bacterium]
MPPLAELHIIAPGICGPLAEIQSLKDNRDVSRWMDTLSKARCKASTTSLYATLSAVFDLDVEGDFPSAAFTLLASGLYDVPGHYMHADPVHLQADMNHAILTSADDMNIREEEAAAICDSLNQHFAQDGVEFFVLDCDQWFVRTDDKISMLTTPLTEAVGRNVNFILPEGEQAMHWKQCLTEIQMLMFSHPVNEDREMAGYPAVNSLWFHGIGNLPDLRTKEGDSRVVDSLCSDQTMVEGLARHVRCDFRMMPDSVDHYLKYLSAGGPGSVNVLHLSALASLVNYTDVRLWTEKLLALLDNWIYPLLAVAHKRKMSVTLYACNGKQYHFSKHDDLRFWRRGKIEQHVHCYKQD